MCSFCTLCCSKFLFVLLPTNSTHQIWGQWLTMIEITPNYHFNCWATDQPVVNKSVEWLVDWFTHWSLDWFVAVAPHSVLWFSKPTTCSIDPTSEPAFSVTVEDASTGCQTHRTDEVGEGDCLGQHKQGNVVVISGRIIVRVDEHQKACPGHFIWVAVWLVLTPEINSYLRSIADAGNTRTWLVDHQDVCDLNRTC